MEVSEKKTSISKKDSSRGIIFVASSCQRVDVAARVPRDECRRCRRCCPFFDVPYCLQSRQRGTGVLNEKSLEALWEVLLRVLRKIGGVGAY